MRCKLRDFAALNQKSYTAKLGWKYLYYLDTGNITKNVVVSYQKFSIPDKAIPSRAKRLVKNGTIIYSTVRPNQLHYGLLENIPNNLLVSTGFTTIDVNPKFADERYVFYFLTQESITKSLHALAEQSVSTYPSIKADDIGDIEIDLPPLETQKKISKLISSIDEKIKLNKEINDNLCEQIKATYKRIINGSNNLKVTRIGDLPIYVTDYVANGSFASLKENVTLYQEPNYAYFIRNTDLKSGNFDVYVDEHSYNFLSKSALKGKEIIISNVGDVGSVFLCPMLNKPMTLGNNVIMIEPEDEKLRYYLYSLFKWFDGYNLIQGIKGGSAVPKFNKTDFKNIQINLPLEKELEEFNNFVSPYFEKLIQNQDANKHLSELRDSLLPKLMSGEIDVDSIEL